MVCRVTFAINCENKDSQQLAANVNLFGKNEKDITEQVNELKQRFTILNTQFFS